MRDPMSWSIPVFRAFGIPVRVHIFFFVVTIGLFLRQISLPQFQHVWWVDIFLLTIVVLFFSVVLHEFGHCFGGRYVGGEAREILIWPLGGLAFVDVPHRWKPLFVTIAAGPSVNALICFVCAFAMLSAGFVPSFNPAVEPYSATITNRDGRTYTSSYAVQLYKTGTTQQPTLEEFIDKRREYEKQHGPLPKIADTTKYAGAVASMGYERALAPQWVAWAYRIFWMNWIMLLFNLLPAYPLDGGQMLQALIWSRTDYRRGVVVAAYVGFATSIVFLIVSIVANEALFMGLALFMLYSASLKLMQLEMEEGPFGYDFSAGYTSLEKDNDDDAPLPPKQPGVISRWWQARKARKAAREMEQNQLDEERMDLLLEKIGRSGQGSLTDEERQFLKRVSARKRNTS